MVPGRHAGAQARSTRSSLQGAVSAARCAVNTAASAARHGRNGGSPAAVQDAVSSTDDAPEVVAAIAILADRAALLLSAGGAGLLDCFAAIPDPPQQAGIRHGLLTA